MSSPTSSCSRRLPTRKSGSWEPSALVLVTMARARPCGQQAQQSLLEERTGDWDGCLPKPESTSWRAHKQDLNGTRMHSDHTLVERVPAERAPLQSPSCPHPARPAGWGCSSSCGPGSARCAPPPSAAQSPGEGGRQAGGARARDIRLGCRTAARADEEGFHQRMRASAKPAATKAQPGALAARGSGSALLTGSVRCCAASAVRSRQNSSSAEDPSFLRSDAACSTERSAAQAGQVSRGLGASRQGQAGRRAGW